MKSRFICVLITGAVILASRPAAGAEIAGGLVLGVPTALSLRINKFPVLAFGWGWAHYHNYMYVNCDYWIIDRPLPDAGRLDWFLGIGGSVGGGHEGFLGCRVPIGLKGILERRFELFGELAPGISLVPEVGLFINGGIGLRYIF
jgi:hypothetical protein